MSEGAVRDDAAGHRFLLEVESREAELVYRREGGRLVLVHTGVPDALSGRGIGGRLVAAAVERARRDELVLVPVCPYARRWLEKHPDEVGGVSIDWPSAEPPDAEVGSEEASRRG